MPPGAYFNRHLADRRPVQKKLRLELVPNWTGLSVCPVSECPHRRNDVANLRAFSPLSLQELARSSLWYLDPVWRGIGITLGGQRMRFPYKRY